MMFDGLLVLDISQVFAGPLMARLLAEGGATVVKVERPDGDLSRALPWIVDGHSGYFIQQNRGKLGLSMNLKSEDGRALLWHLIENADVVIDGFSPGVLARLGFASDEMLARNGRLIICELSALGRGGALGDQRGYDPIGACWAGVAYAAGNEGDMPVLPLVAMGDAMMGICGYAGVVSALFERERSGRGQVVDVSLVDSYIQAHANTLEIYSLSGGKIGTRPVNGQNPAVSPSGVFASPDGGYLYLVAMSDGDWARLVRCMGRLDLVDDPRFITVQHRRENRDALLEAVQDWIDSCGQRDAAVAALNDAGVAAAPVLSTGEVLSSDYLRERGTVDIVTDPLVGTFSVPGPPFRFSRSGRVPLANAPRLGEHNRQILTDVIGLDDERADAYLVGSAFAHQRVMHPDPTAAAGG